jgi:hypothetical protein
MALVCAGSTLRERRVLPAMVEEIAIPGLKIQTWGTQGSCVERHPDPAQAELERGTQSGSYPRSENPDLGHQG